MSDDCPNCPYNPTIPGISKAECDSAFEWLFTVLKAIEARGETHRSYRNAAVLERLIVAQTDGGVRLHDLCHQRDTELIAKGTEIIRLETEIRRLQGELRDLMKTVAGQAMIIEAAELGEDEETSDVDVR